MKSNIWGTTSKKEKKKKKKHQPALAAFMGSSKNIKLPREQTTAAGNNRCFLEHEQEN